MLVSMLRTIEYDQRGSHWRAEDIVRPAWPPVETSIRRLDKFRFPYIWLYLKSGAGNDHPDFAVMGGKSDYWMAGSVEGFFQRRYRNPNPGDEDEVPVWTSDQGFSDADEFICHEIEVVLRAVKYFCQTGGFDPTVTWE